MSSIEWQVESQPAPDQVQFLEDRLDEFNSQVTGMPGGAWLAIFVRDEAGQIVAGIGGNTWGECCEIRQLWVAESRRGQGLGGQLFGAAEAEARRRGCRRIFLTTFSFQAPDFYRRLGFTTVATLDDYPRGHQNLVMMKQLD